MRLTCKQQELVEALQMVERAAPARPTLPILSGVLLEAEAEQVRMVCNDLEMGIEVYMPAEVVEEGSAVLPARLLADFVRRLQGEKVDFQMGPDGGSMTVSSGRSRIEVNTMDVREFPEFPEVTGGSEVVISGKSFLTLIAETAFAASQDDTRPFLTGVLFEICESKLALVATDTFRLALGKMEVPSAGLSVEGIIIPSRTLREMERIIGGKDCEVRVALGANQVGFTAGGTRVVSRLIEGRFPNYRQVIPQGSVVKARVGRVELMQAIERVSLLQRDEFGTVNLVIGPTHILVKGESPDLGKAFDEVECSVDGDPTEVILRSRYILEGLRALGVEEVMIEITGDRKPTCLRKAEGDDYIYMVMPVATE